MQTMDLSKVLSFGWEKVTCIVQKQLCSDDGLSKALVRALPYGIVWEDEPSPFVVSGVENWTRVCKFHFNCCKA